MRSSSVFCVGWRNIEEANTADRYAGLVIFHRTWHDNSIASTNTRIRILEERI